jgi:8-oxo-dGTP pyrophosphatase MutT (NUDIX family)
VDKEEIRRRLRGGCSLEEAFGDRRSCLDDQAMAAGSAAAGALTEGSGGRHAGASASGATEALAAAAVLVCLVGSPQGPQIILTQRTAGLRSHPAEISLPGGRVESGDASPVAAALREASEEVGLPAERVEILGCLPEYRTVTDYCVQPVVGWIEPPVALIPDEREVAAVFLVPLDFVLDPLNHQQESLWRDGHERSYYVLPYPGRRIWGATAAILISLARVLAD